LTDSKRLQFKELIDKKIPITTSNIYHDSSRIMIFIEFFLGTFIFLALNYWYFSFLYTEKAYLWLIPLPFFIYTYIYEYTFLIALIGALFLKILRKIHPIQEGIFDLNSKEFKYYRYRYWTAYFPIWLARGVPLPWIDFVIMKLMGSKIGKNVCLYDSWMDFELIDVGDNVMTSINTVIMSHAVFQDKFIQLKTVLEVNSITGAESVIAPGTYIEENAVLGANGSTYIGQHLKGNCIHIGSPASKEIPIKITSKSIEKKVEEKK
jgi:acetyltransferase-like isoleucine patch superfamily enzyme